MGLRYERSRKNVSENVQVSERIKDDKETLKNEYSHMFELNSMLGELDCEVAQSIRSVDDVGKSEGYRLNEEQENTEKESERISDDIDDEIEKLNVGLKKLKSLEKYEYGKNGQKQVISEYQKQIQKFKEIKSQLLETSKAEDNVETINVISENASVLEELGFNWEEESINNSNLSTSHIYAKQTEHKPLVASNAEAIKAVANDIYEGSGKVVSKEQAEKYYHSIQLFSRTDNSFMGNDFRRIRSAYNNPNASAEDRENLDNLDEYLKGAPKWEGQVYRGINIDRKTAERILEEGSVDMLGPASWSSEVTTAERFSFGKKDTRMVFVLSENKSGASITHVAAYDGMESEITAPSGIRYTIDRIENINKDNKNYIFVYVHE